MQRYRVGACLVIALIALMIPAAAHAQSSIAGVVKDTSGGALPGVQVDAASPVLIEGVKSATTDGEGNYKIIDLRPGTYTVSFTLQGFAPLKRTEIIVPADTTVTVSSEMKLGSLAEAITVTTAAPFVDVQSAARTQQLDKAAMDNIPTSRTIQSMGQLIPGVTISTGVADVGGSNAAMQSYMTVRGIPAAQNSVMVDGMAVNGVESNGAIQAYFNDAASDQIVYQTSDTTASSSGGGVQVNMIPREGGNRFSGDSQLVYRPGEGSPGFLSGLQSSNLSDRLVAMKIPNQPGQVYISDMNVAQGGPIAKNKIWFFASARDNRVNNYVLNTKFDNGDPGANAEYIKDVLARGTAQINPRLKVTGYYDRVWKDRAHAMSALQDPETAALHWTSPNYSTGSAKATYSATSRLFVEGGYSFNIERRNETTTGIFAERNEDPISLMGTPGYQTNEWYANPGEAGGGGRAVSANNSQTKTWPEQGTWQASATYLTGSHSIKGGFQLERGIFYHAALTNGDVTTESYDVGVQDPVTSNWTFSSPTRIAIGPGGVGGSGGSATIVNTPRQSQERMNAIAGYYIQDQYKFKRLTVNGGIRYETANSQVDQLTAPAGRWVPARTQPEVKDRPDWKNWAPRSSFVYDLFGNGRTALKYSLNKYNTAETTGTAAGFNVLGSSTSTRQWTDLNGDHIVQGQRTFAADGTPIDCVYQTPGCEVYLSGPSGVNPVTGAAQTLTPLAANFGQLGSVPAYLGSPRQWRLEQGVEVQHQLMPRLGLTFAYVHWERFNNLGSVNQFRTADQYVERQFFNPISGELLPYTYYDLTAAGSTAQSANGAVLTDVESKYKVKYNSYQVDFRARPYRGAQLFGGVTFQRTRSISCETSTQFLIAPNSLTQCNDNDLLHDYVHNKPGAETIGTPMTKDFKVAFSMPIWYGFTASASYQNLDQGGLTRSFSYGTTNNFYPDGSTKFVDTRGVAVPAVPCPAGQAACAVPGAVSGPGLVAGTASLAIDLPGLNRDERLNQLDLKFSKTFRTGRLTIAPTFEVFNMFNGDTIISRTSVAYPSAASGTSTFMRPSSVLKPRLLGFGTHI